MELTEARFLVAVDTKMRELIKLLQEAEKAGVHKNVLHRVVGISIADYERMVVRHR